MPKRRIALAAKSMLILLLLGGLGFWAVGGRPGALLLFVKYVLRKDYGPTQEVVWRVPTPAATPTGARPPNVLLIVADDLGFNDITLHGGGVAGGSVPTPHIDSIARQGVDFLAGYSGNATCAPSRAAIMTGRYPTRFGFEFTPTPKQFMQVLAAAQPKGEFKGGAAIGVLRQIVVADTDAQAIAIAAPAVAHHHANLTHLARKHAHEGSVAQRLNIPLAATVEDALREGAVIAGTPETVCAEIERQVAELGINYLLTYPFFGDMRFDQAMRSLNLFANEVMPKLAHL